MTFITHAALLISLLPGNFCNAANKPNIILIFTDDHGFTDMACQGIRDDLKTPNIDALAANGVRMTSGYVTAPQCVPSRAGLLTGRSQNRFGVESNGQSLDGFNAQQTIAERLKKAGYATGMTGKWHLGAPQKIVDHGFDDVYYKNSNRPGWANFDLDGNDCKPGPERSKLYHLDANSAAACAFIERHHDEPFFFYCAYRAPHVPLDAPPKYLNRFPGEMPERRRQALAMVSAMDDGIGRIMATLKQHKLEENTLIFFIGDNGAPLKIHKLDAPGGGPGWDGSLNEPLNGEKGMLSEGGIRVPFVVHWKGHFKGGQVYDHPVSSLDVAATAVALAGLEHDSQLDGVNLAPFLSGENKAAPHETLYWRWIAQAAVREGKWKYLRGGSREYLYDLNTDIEEKHNLLTMHPDIAAGLRTKLTAWSAELQPPGFETKGMSQTWEDYYDFYLDGKPAPKVRAKSASKNTEDRIQGWLVRGGKLNVKNGELIVQPQKKGKQRPFIVTTGIKWPKQVTAVVKMKSPQAGPAGFAWRCSGQKDFVSDQVAMFDCTQQMKTHEVSISAVENIIHLRVLLPPGGATIESVKFQNAAGKVLKEWAFSK